MKYMINCLILILLSANMAEAPPSEEKGFTIIMPIPEETPIIENEETIIIKDLSVLHPAFRNKVVMLLYECAKVGIELEVVETYRHPERQNELRRKGYSMLHGGRSKHQHHLAVDVVPVKWGWYMWHDKELWKKVGEIGEKQGLLWGGRWQRFADFPHFEYPAHIDSVAYIPIPDTVIIPLNHQKWK